LNMQVIEHLLRQQDAQPAVARRSSPGFPRPSAIGRWVVR
jgi:hypothetical protein